MSSRISYHIVHCSSYDPAYPPGELESTAEHSKGWQSARFNDYPQELVFAFEKAHDISQIQILSHQAKISGKIEIYVAGTNEGHDVINWKNMEFKRLGFDPNARSNWKARELKSVFVETRCQFLKLVIHQPHINAINLFNQVGVMAVNILGSANTSQAQIDDLSLDIQLDAITVNQIRQLHAAKVKAAQNEQYEDAKRLKQAIADLKNVGAKLAKLEKAKMQAVADEDYDRAKLLKDEIDRLRNTPAEPSKSAVSFQQQSRRTAEKHVETPTYLQPQQSLPPSLNSAPSNFPPSFSQDMHEQLEIKVSSEDQFDRPIRPSKKAEKISDEDINKLSQDRDELFKRPVSQAPVSPQPNVNVNFSNAKGNYSRDDRPLPTSKVDPNKEPLNENGDDPNGVVPPDPPSLSAKDAKEMANVLGILDELTVRGICSRHWQHRESAIDTLKNNVPSLVADATIGPKRCFDVLTPMLLKILGDKVPQVYIAAVDVWTLMIDNSKSMSQGDLERSCEPMISLMIKRLDDPNQRVRALSLKTLNALATQNNLCNTIATLLLQPLKPTASPTLFDARLSFLMKVIPQYGINANVGLGLDDCMNLISSGLQHKNGSTRDYSVRACALVYEKVGKRVRDYFKELRPAMIEVLNAAFGVAPETDVGPSNSAPKKANNNSSTKKKKSDDDDFPVQSVNQNIPCEFCAIAIAPANLDKHLFSDCCMLISCNGCQQIVEIPILTEHYLTECTVKRIQCQTCKEAFLENEIRKHESDALCKACSDPSRRCPLCHKDTAEAGMDGWRKHLKNCIKNPRKVNK